MHSNVLQEMMVEMLPMGDLFRKNTRGKPSLFSEAGRNIYLIVFKQVTLGRLDVNLTGSGSFGEKLTLTYWIAQPPQ